MTHKYRFCWIIMLLLCLTACSDDTWDGVQQGSAVPEFSVQSADGKVITAEGLRGKPYLVVFFSTTCKDCQQELPVIQQIYNKYKYDITFVDVARNESADDVAQYWQQQGFTMPYYTSGGSDMYQLFAQTGVPRVYLVDYKGTILSAFDDSNMPDSATMSKCIDDCLDADPNFVSLTVDANVVSSRALGSTDVYPYYEYSINKLYAYFYDADTKELIKEASISNLTKKDDEPGQVYDITYLCNGIRLHHGKYDMFFIANTEYPPVDVKDESEFLNTIDDKTYTAGIMASSNEKGIVMTNTASENCNIDLSDQTNKHYLISVKMDRALAKVQLGCDSASYTLSHDGVKYANVNITNYQLVNLNTSFYLFRHTAMLTSFKQPYEYALPDNFEDDDDVERYNNYVIDPNFFDKTADEAGYKKLSALYESPFVKFGSEHMASMPAAGNVASAYILENTCFSSSQLNGYSAGVVFKAAVHPVCVYTYDTESKQLVRETRSEYWPEKLYFWNYNFYGSLRSLNVASTFYLDELKTYTDAELLKYGVKQANYHQGVYETYYTYWIRHNTDTPIMKYSIVRNNFYKLLITGISGIGNSTITPEPLRNNDDNSYSDDIIIE